MDANVLRGKLLCRGLKAWEQDRAAEAVAGLQMEIVRLTAILNTPLLEPFADAAVLEAKHQRLRHGDEHDAAKDALDWVWTLGHLANKAARSDNDGDLDKAMHHTITAAALLANWHRHLKARKDEQK